MLSVIVFCCFYYFEQPLAKERHNMARRSEVEQNADLHVAVNIKLERQLAEIGPDVVTVLLQTNCRI